jgi:hypothetical protein
MMDLGQAMVKVDAAAAKSKDYADLEEGRAKIQEESAAHDQFRLENLNPLEWVRNLDRHVGNAVKWLAGAERSPRVQAQLQADVQKMKDHGELQHAFDASALQMRRAGEANARKVEGAVKSGSVPMLEEAIEEGKELGVFTQDDGNRLYEEGKQRIYGAVRQEMILTNPSQVLEWSKDPMGKEVPDEFRGMSGAQWVVASNDATTSMLEQKRGLVALATNDMYQGTIKTVDELNKFVTTRDPYHILEQGDYDHLRGVLEGRQPRNQDADWNTGYQMIQGMNLNAGESTVRKQEAQVRHWVDMKFEGRFKDEMHQLIDTRLKEVDDLLAGDMKLLGEYAAKAKNSGAYGPPGAAQSAVARLMGSGVTLPNTPMYINGTYPPAARLTSNTPAKDGEKESASTDSAIRLALQEVERKSRQTPGGLTYEEKRAYFDTRMQAPRSKADLDKLLNRGGQSPPLLPAQAPAKDAAATLNGMLNKKK